MKNVVIVDDYFDFAKALAEFIESNHKVYCKAFANSVEAYEYVTEAGDVEIVIADYEMPRMNGFELATKLLEKFSNLRIIIVSGHTKKHLESIAAKHGLERKVEVTDKSDYELYDNLFN